MKRLLLALAAALIAVPAVLCAPAHATSGPQFTLKWSSTFPLSTPVGSFSGCSGTTYQCSGIKNATLHENWGAYPSGWPDTCAGKNADVCAPGSEGADYEPQDTVSIANHMMIIKETPGAMAAVVPLQALNMTYGEFTEKFRVTEAPAHVKNHPPQRDPAQPLPPRWFPGLSLLEERGCGAGVEIYVQDAESVDD